MTESEIENLTALGFIVTRLSPYHYRISMEEKDVVIDYWPTTGKYLPFVPGQGFEKGKAASITTNIMIVAETVFNYDMPKSAWQSRSY